MNYLIQIAKAVEITLPSEADPTANPSGVTFEQIILLIIGIINILLNVAGIVCLVLVFYSALMYAFSYGDEAKVQTAKKTITWALVGLLIVSLAATIVYFFKSEMAREITLLTVPLHKII